MQQKVEILVKPYETVAAERELDVLYHYLMAKCPWKEDGVFDGAIEGRVDDVLGGGVFMFPTRLCYDGTVYPIAAGSDFWVDKAFRKYELGLSIPEKMLEISPNILLGGVSREAEPVYKLFGYSFFDIPRQVYIVNSHFLVSRKLGGWAAKLVTSLIDAGLHLAYTLLQRRFRRKYARFRIVEKKVGEIDYPGIERIMEADGHPYRELHDKDWIDWVMKYADGHPESRQYFYEVYLDDRLVGFFLNKVKFRELLNGRFADVKYGTVLEWGSLDQGILMDSDLCAMAFAQFGKRADAIALCSTDPGFCAYIPKKLRKEMGHLNYAVALEEDKFPGFRTEGNWRIRPAGGDASF